MNCFTFVFVIFYLIININYNMRKAFLAIIFMFSLKLFAQSNLEDVVYLKDGGIMRGIVIEQIPNQLLKIQTRDGNVFVYSFDKIEKITKEKSFLSDVPNITPIRYAHLSDQIRHLKNTGIGLTVTSAAFVIIGGSLIGTSARTYYTTTYYGQYSFTDIDPARFISGLTFLCASVPFLIAGPIEFAKYGRLKREQKSAGVSFAPSIKTHNFDGISKVPSATSYGMSMRFTF